MGHRHGGQLGGRVEADRPALPAGQFQQAGDAPLQGKVRLDMTTGLARHVVMPLLPRLLQSHPALQLELSCTERRVDLVREGFDCVLRVGTLADSSLIARPLGEYRMVNCASPAYLANHRIDEARDLANCTLLRSDGEGWSRSGETWSDWFKAADLDWGEPESGLFFFDFALALTWAENGHGVALTRRSLADEALREGRLRHILDVTLPDDRAYWFVTQQGIELTPLVSQFRAWMFEEAAAMNLVTCRAAQ